MLYLDISNRISFVIVECTSFFILVFTVCMIKNSSLLRLLGMAFVIPFLLNTISFFTTREVTAGSLAVSAELTLLAAIFILLALKPKSGHQNFVLFIFFITPGILYFLLLYSQKLSGFLASAKYHIPAYIILTVLIMFLLRKEKGLRSMIFWSMLLILSGVVIKALSRSTFMDYVVSASRACAYALFLIYFCREAGSRLVKKMEEAEKKKEVKLSSSKE